MENNLQPVEPEQNRKDLMPVLDPHSYNPPASMKGVQPADLVKFLNNFFLSGNISKSATACGMRPQTIQYHLTNNPGFAADFKVVRDAMKHDLEQVMFNHGLKEKGYMDRITWLRRHYPEEYNPNFDGGKHDDSKSVINDLAGKLKDYDLIPKSKIVDAENDNG